jgi:uncharacterized membrane protein (UPF0127 family)
VASEVQVADKVVSQLIGWIGRKEIAPQEGLWLPFCSGVHTFFLRFPVDVIFLDSNYRVIGLVENLKPWRSTRFFWNARYALELPSGTISTSQTHLGDQLAPEDPHESA